jgi:SOS-response transcriptional repressor LexA
MSNAGARQKSRLQDVLAYLRQNPGASQARIMKALGMTSKSHLQKCLDIARASGMVRHRGGRGRGSRGYEMVDEKNEAPMGSAVPVTSTVGVQ